MNDGIYIPSFWFVAPMTTEGKTRIKKKPVMPMK